VPAEPNAVCDLIRKQPAFTSDNGIGGEIGNCKLKNENLKLKDGAAGAIVHFEI